MPAKLTEELALVASIPPAVAAATTHASDVIDMSTFHRALFVLTGGAGANEWWASTRGTAAESA
jgi:hypothetical protein